MQCTSTQNKPFAYMQASLFFCLSFTLIFAGCDPIRKVEKSDESIRKVFQYGLLHGILSCLPEIKEVHKIDTITHADTTWVFDTKIIHDTLTKKDTLIETKTRYINNTREIHDTVRITTKDLDEINAVRKDNAEKEGEIKAKNERIKELDSKINWWRIRFFSLLGIFGLCGFFWVRSKFMKPRFMQ